MSEDQISFMAFGMDLSDSARTKCCENRILKEVAGTEYQSRVERGLENLTKTCADREKTINYRFIMEQNQLYPDQEEHLLQEQAKRFAETNPQNATMIYGDAIRFVDYICDYSKSPAATVEALELVVNHPERVRPTDHDLPGVPSDGIEWALPHLNVVLSKARQKSRGALPSEGMVRGLLQIASFYDTSTLYYLIKKLNHVYDMDNESLEKFVVIMNDVECTP